MSLAVVAAATLAGTVSSQAALLANIAKFFDHVSLCVIVTDARFNVLYANAASCECAGYTHDELLAMPPGNWRIYPKPRQLYRRLSKGILQGQHTVTRLTHCRLDGSFWQEERLWLPLEATSKGIASPLLLSLGWDIKEQLAEETRQLRTRSLHTMLTFMMGVSHEFNNVLGSIIGLAELNQALLSEDHPAYENSRQMQKAGERAAALIDDMALCGGSIQLNYASCDPRSLMLASLQRSQTLTGTFPETHLHLDNGTTFAELDQSLLAKALDHMIENALHAMETTSQPCLWLKVNRIVLPDKQTRLEFCVGDNGTGMDEATQARVFDAFYTTKLPGKGRGLGMVVVYACALQHGGDVRLTSVPGEGTEVTLSLPLSSAHRGNFDGRAVFAND